MPTVSYKSTGPVFTKEQEKLLTDYVMNAAKMFHGLSPRIIEQLAFEYAKTNKLRTFMGCQCLCRA